MARGGYTFEQIKQMTTLEILYLYHYQELAIKEQQQYLTNILGVIWNRDTLMQQMAPSMASGSTTAEPLKELFIPLSVAIAPNVMDFVKEQFGLTAGKNPETIEAKPYIAGGDYQPKKNEVIKSMASLSKEEFLTLLGRRR